MARKGHGRPANLVNISSYPDDGSSPVGTNEWNANRDTTGIIGFTKTTQAISSNNLNVTDSYIEVTNAGDIHTLSAVTTSLSSTYYASDSTASFTEGDLIYIVKGSSVGTVNLKHQQGGAGAGKITTLSGSDKVIDSKVPTILMARTIGSVIEWVEYGGGTANNLDTTNFAASTLVIESEGIGSNDNDTTLPTSAAVKDYVDAQVATENTIAEMNDTTITSVGDNEILQYNNSSSVWENQTFTEAGIATLSGSETLASKTLTSPVLNTGVSGSAILDEDNMASNSATQLATQQSIKAYVDAQIATEDTIAELNDTTITSVGDNEILQYNNSSSVWENQTLAEAGIQTALTSGISNTNNVIVDHASVADDDFARFTANGLEGRSASEVLTDIGASPTAGSSSIVTTGALNSGSITSGFGAIDNGASAITTTGTITGGQVTVDNFTIADNKIEITNTNGNLQLDSNGTGKIEILGNTNAGALILNCENNSHGQTLKSQPHSAGVTNELLLPAGANSTLVSRVSADTLTNKTLGTGTTVTLGSDAAIDIYYRSSGGALARLAKGTAGQALKINSGANGLEWGSAGGGATLFHVYANSTTTSYAGQSGESQTLGTAVGSLASGSGDRDVYIRKIDTNNEGVFAVIHKNGSLVEVQVA